jgi:hypothetical protein
MELDPGIHIVMHLVLSYKIGCDRSAELRCIRVRPVKASCSGLRSLKKPNDRYRLFVRI